MPPEPISPELVLVDPELAKRERARLTEKARLDAVLDVAALRPATEPQPAWTEESIPATPWRDLAAFSRKRLLPAALFCSLLANGLFVAEWVAHSGLDAAAAETVRMVPVTGNTAADGPTPIDSVAPVEARTSADPSTSHAAGTDSRRSQRLPVTRASVERKLVSLILTAPPRKLPRNFVDKTTGLVKNNVQIVCQRRKARSFYCAVRLPTDRAKGGGLHVRYQAGDDGRGRFTWYGFKHGARRSR